MNINMQKELSLSPTPFYLFDLEELKRRIKELKSHLPQRVRLCYAVKANTFIAEEVSREAQRLEICSPGELKICQELEIPSRQFVISGVYKEAALMEQMISEHQEVAAYTVESEAQFEILYRLAKKYKRRIPLLLRLTCGNQFGLDKDLLMGIVEKYQNDSYLDLRGIQYFSGTQKTSLKRLKKELSEVDGLLEALRVDYGYTASELEFGPGFPVAYFQGEDFEEEAFLKGFSLLLAELSYQGQIILEVGRSIAASCGKYFTKVVEQKRNKGENYCIVDGGIHHIAYFGQFMAMKHPYMYQMPTNRQGETENWTICGSLCTANDILAKQVPLIDLGVGDVLVFEKTGAYCVTEGIALFLSRDLPAVALLHPDHRLEWVRTHTSVYELNMPHQIKPRKEKRL